ncbi:MAG TPA: acetyl-CoA carboxylase biotin carboxyl carrier protein [Bryobacteraceae bacterium]|nr:acetyl-CoA carboxylase biotin carboxyl carrier protein [Bryobacteraceae bacterium]
MTIDEIKELIRVVQETGILELEVQQGDNRVRIRVASNQDIVLPAILSGAAAGASTGPTAHHAQEAVAAPAATASPEDERDAIVKSPIVGTYYDAPAPGTAPFIKVGDRVEPKQVLCIIESMKLMNEIEAEMAGTVIAKHVENGRPVEYGESLFTIRPI